jgi:hypothetical protein
LKEIVEICFGRCLSDQLAIAHKSPFLCSKPAWISFS